MLDSSGIISGEYLITRAKAIREEAESEIAAMLNSHCPKSLFLALAAQYYLVREGDSNSIHMESCPPFILEILAKFILSNKYSGEKTTIYPEDIEQIIDLLKKYSIGMSFGEGDIQDFAEHIRRQNLFVRGSAFYWQTKSKIQSVFSKHEKYLKEKIGISSDKIINFVDSSLLGISGYMEKEYRNFCFTRDFFKIVSCIEERKKEVLFHRDDGGITRFKNRNETQIYISDYIINNHASKELIISERNCSKCGLSIDEFNALMKLIGVSRDTPERFNFIKNYPLLIFDDGESVLINPNASLDAIWVLLNAKMKEDSAFYERFQKYRARYAEDKTAEYLQKIFPAADVFKNLTYEDPSKDKKSQAELDIAVKWGDFLIVCEVKSKQLREASLAGDSAKLRSDIKSNLEDSYEQGTRAIRYMLSSEHPVFTEKDSGRILSLSTSNMLRIYVMSVTLEQLADIGTRLNHSKALSIFKDGKYPFSISLSDLEVISLTNIHPSTFLHYIEQRLLILHDVDSHHGPKEWHGDELDLFTAYLDSRLLSKNLPIEDNEKPYSLILSSYSTCLEDVDGFYENPHDALKKVEFKIPESAKIIFEELFKHSDDNAKWIAFALHNLPDVALHEIAVRICDVKNSSIPEGRFRFFTMRHADCCVTIVATQHETTENLSERTKRRLLTAKYQSSSRISIAFSVKIGSERLFEAIEYAEFPWEYNEELEKIIEQDAEIRTGIVGKLPGRNAPCPCGSGKKFKKCCINSLKK